MGIGSAGRVGIAVVLITVGCGPLSDSSLAPEDEALSLNVAKTRFVVGSGTFDLTPAGAGIATFDYNVEKVAGRPASGTFSQYREAGGLAIDFTGKASCLTADFKNGRAWVGGVVLENRSTHPSFQTAIHQPGQVIWFRVLDQPGNDRSTVFGFKGAAGFDTSDQYCDGRPWPDLDARTWHVISGEIDIP